MVDLNSQRLDISIRVLFYILIFWLPYSPAIVETSVIFAMLLWIVKRSFILKKSWVSLNSPSQKFFKIGQAFKPRKSALTPAIMFFLAVCIMSMLGGLWPAKSFHGILTKTLEWFIIFYLLIEVFNTQKQINCAIGVLLFTSVSTALDGIWQFFIGRDIFLGHTIELMSRATAGFKTTNALSAFLAFSFFIFLGRMLTNDHKKYFVLNPDFAKQNPPEGLNQARLRRDGSGLIPNFGLHNFVQDVFDGKLIPIAKFGLNLLGALVVATASFLTFSRGGLLGLSLAIIFFGALIVKKNSNFQANTSLLGYYL